MRSKRILWDRLKDKIKLSSNIFFSNIGNMSIYLSDKAAENKISDSSTVFSLSSHCQMRPVDRNLFE